MNELTTVGVGGVGIMSLEQIDLLKKQIAPSATDDELKLFLYHVNRTKLDPFSKQIYFQKRNTKDGPKIIMMTSIDGARVIAQRTGNYGGCSETTYNDKQSLYSCIKKGLKEPTTAEITVYKVINGTRIDTTASVSYIEYYPRGTGDMQVKMPFLMLGKVAEMLALRKAFPMDLSGLYIAEEMGATEAVYSKYIDSKYIKDEDKSELKDTILKVTDTYKRQLWLSKLNTKMTIEEKEQLLNKINRERESNDNHK